MHYPTSSPVHHCQSVRRNRHDRLTTEVQNRCCMDQSPHHQCARASPRYTIEANVGINHWAHSRYASRGQTQSHHSGSVTLKRPAHTHTAPPAHEPRLVWLHYTDHHTTCVLPLSCYRPHWRRRWRNGYRITTVVDHVASTWGHLPTCQPLHTVLSNLNYYFLFYCCHYFHCLYG